MRLSLLLSAVLLLTAAAGAAEINPVIHHPVRGLAPQRIIVKYRVLEGVRMPSFSLTERARALTQRAGVHLARTREIAPDMQALDVGISGAGLASTLARLRADRDVEFAELDERRFAHAVPNDPLHDGQWYLKNVEAAAIDAQSAWDVTTGSKGVVVAVLDTGVRYDHPDLKKAVSGGRLLPGYDFVSPDSAGSFKTANDGDGRDADPSDPGDFISDADKATDLFANCDVSLSSWHGTRVSGIIGALSNNGVGVAGIDWKSYLLPVRVLGKCGGFDSDVIAGMRWAAGLHVNGVPDNPYPAKVINMSLGGTSSCSASYQSVIDELAAAGVLVVVSAGNEGGPVDAPANCARAVGVAGLRQVGTKVGFSSLGPQIALSAPSGNCGTLSGTCSYSLDTTTNAGENAPGANTYTDEHNYNIGTSFSAPIVSGIAALMVAVNGNLNAAQLRTRLRRSASPFPHSVAIGECHVPVDGNDVQDQECNCTTTTCGAGMANASTALDEALRPIAAVSVPPNVSAGQDVTLSASGSSAACGHAIASYLWEIVDPGMNPPAISSADSAAATVTAPASDSFVIRVTVTDEAGHTDTADVTVSATSATTSAPNAGGAKACPSDLVIQDEPTTPTTPTPPTTPSSGGSGGGGGGGALDPLLMLLALACALRTLLSGARAEARLPKPRR